jgi:hypothetical protein
MMLYFSISVLINTSFFPTIQGYMENDVHFRGDVDSSLFEVMLENLLDFEDAGVTLADDADDVSASVDYLSSRTGVGLSSFEEADDRGLPPNYDCPANPALKISTPPPKV